MHTGADLLTTKQKTRLTALFDTDRHLQVEVSWCVYQDMIAAYRNPDRAHGRTAMTKLINTLNAGVPAVLNELVTLGRTLKRRAADVLVAAVLDASMSVLVAGGAGQARGRGRVTPAARWPSSSL